ATSPNAKTILFPVEATQLIGTLGGIGALTKDALASDQAQQAAQPRPRPRPAAPPNPFAPPAGE
ncbi:MAG: SPFH/Band 7/PHB domain protein, partial [Sphingopyxis sp.]|nr:SPFH/Band 7/PHB domain protein [Sphingopyxis sp.]